MIGGMSDLTIPAEDPHGGHLPECSACEACEQPDCCHHCICDRLRQCEQRVKDEARMGEYPRLAREFADGADLDGREDAVRAALRQLEIVRRYARDAALDAAREAVAALPVLDVTDGPEGAFVVRLDEALAAIDALREVER